MKMLRNLSITHGLCDGTRLEVLQLHEHSIKASVISGSHTHNRILIPRIKLDPSNARISFVLQRTQFYFRLLYSMIFNKAQGQTFDSVGIHLAMPYFMHDQLSVAFWRAAAMNNVRVEVLHPYELKHNHKNGHHFYKPYRTGW